MDAMVFANFTLRPVTSLKIVLACGFTQQRAKLLVSCIKPAQEGFLFPGLSTFRASRQQHSFQTHKLKLILTSLRFQDSILGFKETPFRGGTHSRVWSTWSSLEISRLAFDNIWVIVPVVQSTCTCEEIYGTRDRIQVRVPCWLEHRGERPAV